MPSPAPPIREPIATKDGFIAPAWVMWFQKFYIGIGGTSSLSLGDVEVWMAFSD